MIESVIVALAVAGQTFDARTTQVGMAYGETELNPIIHWLTTTHGMGPMYALKIALAVAVPIVAYGLSPLFGVLAALAIGAAGAVAGLSNYLPLRKKGIKIF